MKNALFIQKTDEVISDKMVSILNKYSYTLTDTLTFETFNQFAEQDLDKVDLVAIQDANYLDELPELYFGHKTVINEPDNKLILYKKDVIHGYCNHSLMLDEDLILARNNSVISPSYILGLHVNTSFSNSRFNMLFTAAGLRYCHNGEVVPTLEDIGFSFITREELNIIGLQHNNLKYIL